MAEWACQLREASFFEIELLELGAFRVGVFARCFVKSAISQCFGVLRLLMFLSFVLLAFSTRTGVIILLIYFFNHITTERNVSVNQVLLIAFFLGMLPILQVVWTLSCHFSFSASVILQFFLDSFDGILVFFKRLKVLDEGKHCSIVCGLLVHIRHLNEECNWSQIKHIFLLQITVFRKTYQ